MQRDVRSRTIKERKQSSCTKPQGPSPLGQGIRTTPIWYSPTPACPTYFGLSVAGRLAESDVGDGGDGMAIMTATWIASGEGRGTGGGLGE